MYRRRATRIRTALVAVLIGALAQYALAPVGPARADPIALPELLDEELFCTELTPSALSFGTEPARLDLRVLLDGPSLEQAQAAVAVMRAAYDPLNVEIRPSYSQVRLEGTDADGLIEQSKKLYGGKAPQDVDVVYTLTDKDITGPLPHGKNVAGLADCVGGVRSAERAFAVGESFPATVTSSTTSVVVQDPTGKTMAHEIGHLLGAHHHYASPAARTAEGAGPLTLMGPSLSLIHLRFSALNSAVARGHLESLS